MSTRVEESRNISRDYVQFVCKYGGFKTLNDKLKIARKKNFSSRRLNYKQTEEYEKDDDSFWRRIFFFLFLKVVWVKGKAMIKNEGG